MSIAQSSSNSTPIFKCLQINLRHCKAASANLAQLILDLNIDLVLIQEPYAEQSINPSPANIPPGYTSFHSLSKDHAYGAAILIKLQHASNGRVKQIGLENSAVIIELSTTSGPMCFASVYARPLLNSPVCLLTKVLSNTNLVSRSIVGSDANSKNKLWNSAMTDSKGQDLEEYIVSHGLTIANKNLSELDYVPPKTSFVDLTLVGNSVMVQRWMFLSFESFSDHPYIYFEISCKPLPRAPAKRAVFKLPNIASLNEQIFRSHLSNTLKGRLPLALPSTPETVQSSVQELCDMIAHSAVAAKKRNPPTPFRGKMPWWSRELCALRTKTRQSLKRWS